MKYHMYQVRRWIAVAFLRLFLRLKHATGYRCRECKRAFIPEEIVAVLGGCPDCGAQRLEVTR
jgi:DNA-directed RNA polymerase subunit RPC12/RpoP